jgi:hypothetical protein
MSETVGTTAPVAPAVSDPAPTQTAAPAPAEAVAAPEPSTSLLTEAPAPAAPVAETPAALPPGGQDGGTPPSLSSEAPIAPAAPSYTDFSFPEGIKASPAVMAEATKLFGEYKLPQEGAQKLIDFHAAQVQQAIASYSETATGYWNQKAKDWVKEVQNDPTIGGNRLDTSLNAARAALSEGLSEAEKARLWGDLSDTKMGDHPILVRRLAALGQRMEQVLQATGTTTWDAAMKKLREPAPPPPSMAARAPGSTGRPADRRYSGNRT